MRKLAVAVVVVGTGATTLALLGRASTPGPAHPGGAETARVTRRDVGSVVKATGVIKPMIGAEVRVGSRASGVVRRLHVRIGDRVRKGQPLAELETRELVARRDQAAAALASARAASSYDQADLDRKRALHQASLLSRSDLDLAERASALADEQRREAEASLEYARTQLDYARIEAPIDGVVASVSTQEGETVAASLAAPTFVTLVDLARLEVWAYVDETDIGRIEPGQAARFTVDTYPDHEFEGRTTAIYPRAEIRDNVVNYVTVVRFEPPKDRTLRPEMTTTVKIALATRANVLVVPRRAVRREGKRQFVWCSTRERPERRFVTTGSRDETYWEIVDGLREGDEVLVGEVKGEGEDGEGEGR